MKSVQVFLDADAMAKEIACRWYEGAEQAEKSGGVFSVVLSGGVTASNVYREIGSPLWSAKIPWEKVHIFWSDERCVSQDSDESNFRIICRTFLDNISIPDENVHRIRGEEEPVKESIRYAEEIRDHMLLRSSQGILFDWVLLGLGVDGHTASLFPGQAQLLQTEKLCEVAQHPQTGQKRITLCPSALQKSKCTTYHVLGLNKAEIVSRLVHESSERKKYPAAYFSAEWYLDQAAASLLNFP